MPCPVLPPSPLRSSISAQGRFEDTKKCVSFPWCGDSVLGTLPSPTQFKMFFFLPPTKQKDFGFVMLSFPPASLHVFSFCLCILVFRNYLVFRQYFRKLTLEDTESKAFVTTTPVQNAPLPTTNFKAPEPWGCW